MKVDRYLVVRNALPSIDADAILVDTVMQQTLSTGTAAEMRKLARNKKKADDAPIAQRHRR